MGCRAYNFECSSFVVLSQYLDHEGDGHEGTEGGAEIGEYNDE